MGTAPVVSVQKGLLMRSTCLILAILATAACGGEEPSPHAELLEPSPVVRLDSVSPAYASVEGGEVASVFGWFCAAPVLTVDGVDTSVFVKSREELQFIVPPARLFDAKSRVEVAVTCDEMTSTAGFLTYDPALVVEPQVVAYGPIGDNARPDAGIWVQFNRAMDPDSLAGRIGVEKVSGRVVWDARKFVAAFVPDEPLEPGVRVVAFVRGGEDGVRSSFGGALSQTVSWRYTTCKSCSGSFP